MKLLVWLLILGAAGYGAWNVYGEDVSAKGAARFDTDSLYSVKRGDLSITVTENGYLKAKNDLKIKPEFKREGTITWLIEEGEEVEEGDLLVEFDRTDLETQVDELGTTLFQYRNELEAAQAELEIQKRDNEAAIEKAEFELEMAEKTLEKYEKGEAPNERRKMQLALEKAESGFTRAEERYQQTPDLVEQGFLTKSDEEQERINLREAEINKENATEDLRLFEVYTFPMDLKAKQNSVRDAERNLTNAREKSVINTKEREARVTAATAKVKSTEIRLEKLNEELGFMTIKAPQPGIVHYGDPGRPWMRDQIKVGNQFRRGNTLITLPDLSVMQVLVQVHEADIDLVSEDQDVLVSIESIKDRTFPAKVTHIASVASSNWMDEANKTFRAEITMEPTEESMRAGITATAEIQVEVIEDVLQVPIHSIVAEAGKRYCFLPAEDGYERREVEIGKNNSHYVEVVSGLEEGDEVLLYDPRDEAATARDANTSGEEGGDDLMPVGLTGTP